MSITSRDYAQNISQNGLPKVVTHFMEECGELITKLNKYFFRKSIPVEELVEELVDVRMKLEEMDYILDHYKHISTEDYVNIELEKEGVFLDSLEY